MSPTEIPKEDAAALIAEAQLMLDRGEHATAVALARRALAAADAAGDAAPAAASRAALAEALVRQGDLVAAVDCGQQALAYLQAHASASERAQLLCTLSRAYERAGLSTLAASNAVQALELARAAGDGKAECWAMVRLATAVHDADDSHRSLSLMEQAVDLSRSMPSFEPAFTALNNGARLWVVEADRMVEAGEDPRSALEQARLHAEAAAALARSAGQTHALAHAIANLGGVFRRQRHFQQARQHFQEALAMAQRAEAGALIATLRLALACLAVEEAPDAASCAALEAQLGVPLQGTDPDLLRQARRTLVQAFRATGDLARALEHLERLHAAANETHARQADLQARLLFSRAELEQARHQAERACLEAEVQRLRAEAAQRAKTSFMSTASHELRTPVNGVLGMLELARRRATDPRQIAQLDMAVDAGRGLAKLVAQLLEYVAVDEHSSAEPGPPTDLRALLQAVHETVRAAAQARGLAMVLEVSDTLPPKVHLDAERTRRVLELLLDNALKFATLGPVVLAASWRDGRVLLEVADAGPGIPPEVERRLFQLFAPGDMSRTRVHGGMGLGLALARRLVLSMGGTIGVNTGPGCGSTFYAEWPAVAAA